MSHHSRLLIITQRSSIFLPGSCSSSPWCWWRGPGTCPSGCGGGSRPSRPRPRSPPRGTSWRRSGRQRPALRGAGRSSPSQLSWHLAHPQGAEHSVERGWSSVTCHNYSLMAHSLGTHTGDWWQGSLDVSDHNLRLMTLVSLVWPSAAACVWSWQSCLDVSVVLTLTSDSYVRTVGTTLSSHNHPLLAQARPRSLSLSAPGLRRAAPGLTPPRVRGISRVRDWEGRPGATGQSEHSCRVTQSCLSQPATGRTNQDLSPHPSSHSGHPIGRCQPRARPHSVLITVLAWPGLGHPIVYRVTSLTITE